LRKAWLSGSDGIGQTLSTTASGRLFVKCVLNAQETGLTQFLFPQGLLTLIKRPDVDADEMNAVDQFPN
jgi:hypothetical protein